MPSVSSAAEECSSAKRSRKVGPVLQHLPNGQPYINGWPTDRKAADLTKLDCQTVTEAASWCKKEIVAEQLQSECFGMCDELILWLFMKTVETVPKCYDKWAL